MYLGKLQTAVWQHTGLSLRTKNSLDATGNRLEQLKQVANKKQDAPNMARAYW